MDQIELQNIYKRYRKSGPPAVADFNLRVEQGESVVLVGPSGSGKTTILKLIAGLSPISSGCLLLEGKDARLRPPWERGIGMVFQGGGLYPHLSVYQNLVFGLARYFPEKRGIAAAAEELAGMLGIADLLQRKPGQLSGGQRQRVAIGRAIIRKPKILLMDEPLSNLEPGLRQQLRDELIAIQNRLGITCIHVTHDHTEALTMGDRVVVLNHGRTEQIGTPETLYQQPDNIDVAGFFGDPPMQFVDSARLEKDRQQWQLVWLNKRIKLPDLRLEEGQRDSPGPHEVIVGIRPEAIRLTNPVAPAAWVGELEYAQWRGADTLLHLQCGADKVVVRVAGKQQLVKGNPVAFEIKPADIYLFHKKTRRRLHNG